jgi:hypothetical protein
MSVETKVEVVKHVVLKRVPPGDRWQSQDGKSPILESLTDALEWMYQRTGMTEYFISARRGVVETIEDRVIEVEKPIRKFSIYDE